MFVSTLLTTLLALSAGHRPDLLADIDAAVDRYDDQAIEFRHEIHKNPELGNREFETARLVADHLRSLGMEVETGVAHTGVIGVLKGGNPGPVVAVRADMDALPVTEQTDLPFKSTKRTNYLGQEVGVMHACGHDIHTSVQLGVASVLASIKDDLHGTVKFIFQPAEEGPPPGEEGGAELMVKEGVLDTAPVPEVIFGLHSRPYMEVGQVGYAIGPAMAAVDHFWITVKGKQAHGARPEESIDPVVMASQIVTTLQTLRSRNLPPLEPSVVTVGIIRGGERFNIIPEQVLLEGTVRTYSQAVQDTIESRMYEICDGITRAGGGSFELEYKRITPATINSAELAAEVLPTIKRVAGEENVIELDPVMGGEDFAYFSNIIPGFYYFLGTTKPGTESGGVHTPTFRADDSAVPMGMRVMSSVIVEYLERNAE